MRAKYQKYFSGSICASIEPDWFDLMAVRIRPIDLVKPQACRWCVERDQRMEKGKGEGGGACGPRSRSRSSAPRARPRDIHSRVSGCGGAGRGALLQLSQSYISPPQCAASAMRRAGVGGPRARHIPCLLARCEKKAALGVAQVPNPALVLLGAGAEAPQPHRRCTGRASSVFTARSR